MAKEKNASCIAQPNLPISYSLIMRHEGSYSGFSMCKPARTTKNSAANPNVMRAAVNDIALIDLSVVALAISVRPHLILVTAHPGPINLGRTLRGEGGVSDGLGEKSGGWRSLAREPRTPLTTGGRTPSNRLVSLRGAACRD